MQTAGEAVSAARAFVKLAARMQAGEHQFNDGRFFFGVHAKRNATAIVFDADRAIAVQRDANLLAVSGQGLVSRVVQHFLNDVQRVVGAGVHARTLLDGFESFEDANRAFRVLGRCGGLLGCHGPGL